jgi:hypothetical protein
MAAQQPRGLRLSYARLHSARATVGITPRPGALPKNAARVTSVKCAEALGKEVPFWTLRRFPSYIYFGVWVLMFFGAASLVQIAFGLF